MQKFQEHHKNKFAEGAQQERDEDAGEHDDEEDPRGGQVGCQQQ